MRNPKARVPDFSGFFSHPGETEHIIYAPSFAADGTIVLSASDVVDIKKEINSYRDQTDMAYILSRLMAGDDSVLTDKSPMYGDFTQFPRTYAEMLQLVQNGEDAFNALPADVRLKFDNDRCKWFASIGTDDWFNSMGITREPIREADVAIDVKPDVVKEVGVLEP